MKKFFIILISVLLIGISVNTEKATAAVVVAYPLPPSCSDPSYWETVVIWDQNGVAHAYCKIVGGPIIDEIARLWCTTSCTWVMV